MRDALREIRALLEAMPVLTAGRSYAMELVDIVTTARPSGWAGS